MSLLARADHCLIALAELFADAGEIMVSPMGPLPALAARLARRTFAPDLLLTDGVAALVDDDGVVEGQMTYSRVFDTLWNGRRHVVMGASQLDRFGNQNISALGPHERPTAQLIGARGAPGNTVCHRTSYWVPRHSPRVFVPAVDFVCGVGTNRGAQGLGGLVTHLGTFDWGGPGGTMRLTALHPGVTVDEVIAATGFPVAGVEGEVPTTRAPTAAEQALIDGLLDPKGRRAAELG
jgi:acyl CoA:acetate/3-ketoacid CoA transferase beta subunit